MVLHLLLVLIKDELKGSSFLIKIANLGNQNPPT